MAAFQWSPAEAAAYSQWNGAAAYATRYRLGEAVLWIDDPVRRMSYQDFIAELQDMPTAILEHAQLVRITRRLTRAGRLPARAPFLRLLRRLDTLLIDVINYNGGHESAAAQAHAASLLLQNSRLGVPPRLRRWLASVESSTR